MAVFQVENSTSSYEYDILNCKPQFFYHEKCTETNVSDQNIIIPRQCVPPWTETHHLDRASLDLKLVCHGEIWTPDVIQRIVTLVIIMTLTLFGNIVIIMVLTCSKYRMLNSRVNIFIISLAIGDLTVCCFTMTTEALFVVFEGSWVLGPVACKVLLYVQTITLASTTFILTAMSCDRYLAICRPLNMSGSRARKGIIAAWVLAFVFALPQIFIFKEVPDGIYPDGEIKFACKSHGYTAWWQRKLYMTVIASYVLVIPTCIISYCYINVVCVVWRQGKEVTNNGVTLRRTSSRSIPKAKVKTIKMTLSIILSFIMCWTPYFVVHLIHVWSEYRYSIPEPVYVFAETMALLNSALNPILYGCFNIKLKRGLMEVFCPQKLREIQSLTACKQNRNQSSDYHCINVAKTVRTRCTEAASTSSTSSQKGEKESAPPGSARPKQTTIDTGDRKNGYKLRVSFLNASNEDTKPTFPM